MSAAPLICATELRRRLRNRSAIFTAFVGPLVLAVVFGLLLGGTTSFSVTIGVADADGSAISTPFTEGLLSNVSADSPVTFVAVTADDARRAVDDGDVDAAIVVPAGFGDAVASGSAASLEVLRDPAKQVSGEIARSIAQQYTAGVGARVLAAVTSASLGAPVGADALGDFQDSAATAYTEVAPGGGTLDATTYFGASMSILFLFFTVSFAARSITAERRSGLVPRMLAAAARPADIVAGKVAAVAILGLAGFITVWAVTSLAFDASWGAVAPVIVTMVATVLAIAGVSTFVCGFARTEQQADAYTSAVTFLLALLGGNFVGPGTSPDALRRIAAFTPNGQSLDAFTRIAVDGAGIGDITRNLVVLALFAVVLGGIGMAFVHRTVTG
ncbi:MAG: ABC transporter permease [Ilumatobacteraceae bacterium]